MHARNSAYAFWYTTDIQTDRPTDTYISCEISIEHSRVGLASLAQLQNIQSPEIFISSNFEKEAQTLKNKTPKTQNASSCHKKYTRRKIVTKIQTTLEQKCLILDKQMNKCPK